MFVHECHPDAHALPRDFFFVAFVLDGAYDFYVIHKLVSERIRLHFDIMFREKLVQILPQEATDLGNDCLVSSRGGID